MYYNVDCSYCDQSYGMKKCTNKERNKNEFKNIISKFIEWITDYNCPQLPFNDSCKYAHKKDRGKKPIPPRQE
jgi:hypothetical protein